MTHIEVIPGHDIGIITTITEVAHNAQALHMGVTTIDPAMTHHINHTTDVQLFIPFKRSKSLMFMPILQILDEIHTGLTQTPIDHEANPITRRTPE